MILYLFSPALNAFTEWAGKRKLEKFLIAFFLLQTCCDFLNFSDDFECGYSALSFMGLYLLARYLRLHCPWLAHIRTRRFWQAYGLYAVLVTAAIVALSFVLPEKLWGSFSGRIIRYTSPFVIFASAALLLAFTRLHFTSRFVNAVAAGSFAVYLLNVNYLILPLYVATVQHLHARLSPALFPLACGGFILAFFAGAVLADRLRLLCWRLVERSGAGWFPGGGTKNGKGLARFWEKQ